MGRQTIHALFLSALDVILPRKARTIRAEDWTIHDVAISPVTQEACGVRITTLMDYKNPAVEDCIRALKYDGSSCAASLLSEALADYLREQIAEIRVFSPRPVLLVPIPLHRVRERERGFNQVETVLKKLPEEFRDGTLAAFAPRALVRTRETKQQTRLAREERLKNMAGAFAVPASYDAHNAHIFLIDDVTTTGATLAHAARPLREAGAEVTALALARA
ncbi:MAG: ComF family protein [bacterium]|nr:ComF family protein [bacterium]